MTAFNRATDLPASIDTLEGLLGWAILTYHDLYRSDSYQEIRNYPNEPVVALSVNVTADGVTRIISRFALPLDPNHGSTAGKMWGKILEQNTTPIPAAYKVD